MIDTAIPCVNDLPLPNSQPEKPRTAGLMIPQYGTLKSKLPKLNTVWKKAQYCNAVNPDALPPPPPPHVIEPLALICGHPRDAGKWPLNSLIIRGTS